MSVYITNAECKDEEGGRGRDGWVSKLDPVRFFDVFCFFHFCLYELFISFFSLTNVTYQ